MVVGLRDQRGFPVGALRRPRLRSVRARGWLAPALRPARFPRSAAFRLRRPRRLRVRNFGHSASRHFGVGWSVLGFSDPRLGVHPQKVDVRARVLCLISLTSIIIFSKLAKYKFLRNLKLRRVSQKQNYFCF